ncbi:hypothetical protein WGPJNHAJ_CDS0136 [Staphylococcus phage PG-2021_19]
MIVLKLFVILILLIVICHVLFCIYLMIKDREFIKKELMEPWKLYLNLFLAIFILLFYIGNVVFIIMM